MVGFSQEKTNNLLKQQVSYATGSFLKLSNKWIYGFDFTQMIPTINKVPIAINIKPTIF